MSSLITRQVNAICGRSRFKHGVGILESLLVSKPSHHQRPLLLNSQWRLIVSSLKAQV
jgi:hypothetical protein